MKNIVCEHCEGEGHTEDCGGEEQPCPVCKGYKVVEKPIGESDDGTTKGEGSS